MPTQLTRNAETQPAAKVRLLYRGITLVWAGSGYDHHRLIDGRCAMVTISTVTPSRS